VDVVRFSALDNFVKTRRSDAELILEKGVAVIESLREAFRRKDFSTVAFNAAPRGHVGLPPLLEDLYRLIKTRKRKSHAPERPWLLPI